MYQIHHIHPLITSLVDKEIIMEAPIQAEYFLSGGDIILIFVFGGANLDISFSSPMNHQK